VTTWRFTTRPAHPRNPQVVLFAFSAGPLRAAPPRDHAPCRLQTITRAQDPAWFDAWRTGSLRAIATQDLGADLALLDAADHAHLVACEPRGVVDLAYLQAAWAVVRHLADRGATVVLDAMAMTYAKTAALPPPDAPLEVSREIRVVYETDSTRTGRAHAIHTRGMRKFGAPDLVALIADDDVALVGQAITELADQVARGTDLGTPMHAVEVAPGVRWVAVEDEHHLGELLQLGNEARVLVDADGHDLVGVSGRLGGGA
jgi:hypothetical protein